MAIIHNDGSIELTMQDHGAVEFSGPIEPVQSIVGSDDWKRTKHALAELAYGGGSEAAAVVLAGGTTIEPADYLDPDDPVAFIEATAHERGLSFADAASALAAAGDLDLDTPVALADRSGDTTAELASRGFSDKDVRDLMDERPELSYSEAAEQVAREMEGGR